MKPFLAVVLWLVMVSASVEAQKPTLTATRTSSPPKIDGILNDACWQNLPVATHFITFVPEFGKPESQPSEVKIVYDDNAIYVGAFLRDTIPSEIKHQLSQRDDGNALADNFVVCFDTYNDGLNGYRFMVTAAGVQFDEKASPSNNHDISWDAVWQSAAVINNEGWICEIKIPYSAIRFPSAPSQTWGMQFGRYVTKTAELDLWSPVDPKVAGIVNQWGKLTGLENIEPPVRLSFSPYLTAGFQVTPISDDPVDYQTDKLLGGGVDVKYGINESFTIDATLIPDFGQVQSDNLVLNISPFETKFNENRPFFTEGTELFNQDVTNGNTNAPQLFYSRRIGGYPVGYYAAFDSVLDNETMIKNPTSTKLYNATKFSGRTNHGLGIGVLNAVSRPAYAEIRNDETGKTREIQTAPLTNYNVIVFDQSLKYNSKISFENANTWRNGYWPDANVSSIHYDLRNKANSLEVNGFGNYSMRYKDEYDPNPQTGVYYQVNLSETKGKYTGGIWNEIISPHYNQNDLGILYYSNQMTNGYWFNYNNQEPKKGPLFNYNAWGSINYKTQVQPLRYEEWETNIGLNGNFKNYMNAGVSFYSKPFYYWDYYEPRVDTMKYYHHPFYVFNWWMGTDYRKKFYLNVSGTYGDAPEPKNPFFEIDIFPNWIVSDKFNLSYGLTMWKDFGTYGFADFDADDNVIFGQRNTSTVINTIIAKYVFSPKMNISFRARYYWSKVNYLRYFELQQDGSLAPTDYNENNDINFNVFNIDAVYLWEFAPGSFLNIIWKNNILQSDDLGADNYFINCSKTFTAPQTNGLSIKVIYYLDYLMLKKKKVREA